MNNLVVRKKNIIAMLIAAVVAVSGFGIYKTQAAGLIDESKQCSVTVQNPITGYTGNINVDFYKVADVDFTGQFKACGVLSQDQLDSLKDATAETASAMAKSAYEALKVGKEHATAATKQLSFNMADTNQATQALDRAMYLCVPQEAMDDYNKYTFEYFLVSVPSSNYIQSTKVDENGNIVSDSDDQWIYNVQLLLKSKATPRLGNLVIEKELKTFNKSLGTASFVFEVKAVKDGNTVLSNVYTMNFDGAGTDKITVKGIPAGAECFVTEVYSGASYSRVADAETPDSVTIVADEDVTVKFVNDYDERLEVGGVSVENHFEKDAESKFKWTGSNLSNSTSEADVDGE